MNEERKVPIRKLQFALDLMEALHRNEASFRRGIKNALLILEFGRIPPAQMREYLAKGGW